VKLALKKYSHGAILHEDRMIVASSLSHFVIVPATVTDRRTGLQATLTRCNKRKYRIMKLNILLSPTSAILISAKWKSPNVAKTDSKANRRQQKVHLVGPIASFFVFIFVVVTPRLQKFRGPTISTDVVRGKTPVIRCITVGCLCN